MGTMAVGGELKAATVHIGKSILREETNKNLLGKESMENLYENNEVNHGTVALEIKHPILGIEGEEESEKHRGTEEAMLWEKMTRQEEAPIFVFKIEQGQPGKGLKDNLKCKEEVLGPMAMTFCKELGWVAEQLGPKSGLGKRLARKAHVKDQGLGPGPKNAKRESSMPVSELDANTLEHRTNEPTEKPYKIQK